MTFYYLKKTVIKQVKRSKRSFHNKCMRSIYPTLKHRSVRNEKKTTNNLRNL